MYSKQTQDVFGHFLRLSSLTRATTTTDAASACFRRKPMGCLVVLMGVSSPHWSSKICQNTQKHLNNKEKTVLNLEIINFLSWNWIKFPKIERTQKRSTRRKQTHIIHYISRHKKVDPFLFAVCTWKYKASPWASRQKSSIWSLEKLLASFSCDGWNPAPVDMVYNYPIIYGVLYIPGGAGFQPSTVWLRYNQTSQYGDGYKSTFAPSEPLIFFSRISHLWNLWKTTLFGTCQPCAGYCRSNAKGMTKGDGDQHAVGRSHG